MIHLGADNKVLERFQILKKEDVRASTAIINPNIPGSSSVKLSWIWQTRMRGVGVTPDTTQELFGLCNQPLQLNLTCLIVQCVHWLRARAQINRWTEELTLIKYEMEWMRRYFLTCSAKWQARLQSPHPHPGPMACAAWQVAQWRQMASEAEQVFCAVNWGYIKII